MDASSFLCSFQGCRKSFKRKDRLDIHTRTHTGERPYVCHYAGCTSSYARLQHLTRHIERLHTLGYKELSKIRCPKCNQELANTSSLKKHVLNFHDAQTSSNSYKCPEEGCNESFHKKKQLVVHKLHNHSPHLGEARKCYSCPHGGCGKLFSFPNKLKIHLKTHQGYACEVEGCSKVLPNWSSLRKHRTVDHAPVHTCTVCEAVFKQKCNWKQHIKIHSVSQKPHACPREKCDRLFLHKKNLTQHIREFHDGETIWKNRPRKQSNRQHKKQRVSRKKTMAARLCGYDDRIEVQLSHSIKELVAKDSPQDCTETDILKNVIFATSRCNVTDSAYIQSTPDSFTSHESFVESNNNCRKDMEDNLPQSEFITLLAL